MLPAWTWTLFPKPDMPYKRPVSALVVIHRPDLSILLLERAAHPGYWQSVTGSQEEGETLLETALREVAEETGIQAGTDQIRDWHLSNEYEIFPEWRHRYAPGITHNLEHVFSLEVPADQAIILSPREHRDLLWLPATEAAQRCFSWSNRDAILALPQRIKLLESISPL